MSEPMAATEAAPLSRAQRPDRIEVTGLSVVTTAAVVLSFSALTGLGALVGFGDLRLIAWDFPTSLLVPLCIDAYGATAARIAVNRVYSAETRRHAMIHGVIAIGVGILGNAAYHLIEGHVLDLAQVRIGLVIAVSIIPPIALGALVHLMSLCAADRRAAQDTPPYPGPERSPLPAPGQVHVPDPAPAAPPTPRPAELDPAAEAAMRKLATFNSAVKSGLSARLLQTTPPTPTPAAAPEPDQVHPAELVPDQVSAAEPPEAVTRRLLDQLALPLDGSSPYPVPGTAQVHVPVPVPPPTELHLKAVQTFAPDGRLTKLPTLRDIKRELRVGQPKAAQVQEYLTLVAAS